MEKIILRIFGVFMIFLSIPLFWKDKIEFNWAIFTSEYYKFLFNIFIVGIIALYFKSETEKVNQILENSKRKTLLYKNIVIFSNSTQSLDFDNAKDAWNKILKDSDLLINFNSFDKLKRAMSNTSHSNFTDIFKSSDFLNMVKTLKDYEANN